MYTVKFSCKATQSQLFLSCKKIQSHGWRLSSMQNCVAVLQSNNNPYAGLEGRGTRCEAMERKRNPGKPVKNGLFGRISKKITW